MLGNWSFGDYFKREAIHWAWEFLTGDLGIPGERLAATTYKDDEVACERLARRDRPAARADGALGRRRRRRRQELLADGRHRAVRAVQRDPLRPRARTCPKGPHCIPDHSEHCPRWLEIWNLVFMEFDQQPDGRVPLPFPSVDTGLGLERLASVLQQVPTNYDTDLFTPIHARMRELLGHDPDAFESERFSYQVIADHSRAVTFLIADGVLPSNEGRGYVLRRILRRAVRHGRLLGPARAVPGRDRRGRHRHHGRGVPAPRRAARRDPRRDRARGGPVRADARRRARAARGGARDARRRPTRSASSAVARRTCRPTRRVLPGEVAFRLHDTFGFPIDLTVELAAEYGVGVDRAGFEGALAEQRERSRTGQEGRARRGTPSWLALRRDPGPRPATRRFLGYETTTAEGRVVAILRDGMEYDELTGHGEAELVLDQTPFYAEGGGQVGDQGVLREPGGGSELFTVDDTQQPVGGLIVHRGTLHGRLRVGETVDADVDADRRAHTMRNHTGTHLLHRALRNVVGERARQAGSLVTPDYLRFDFPFDRR